MNGHIPVLLSESVQGLRIQPDGTYVDVTFGEGGHSREILKHLEQGQLIALDQDEETGTKARDIAHRSFTFIKGNFRYLKQYLRFHGVKEVDGILADLGIASGQIDQPERGFSYRFDAPLDMRMNTGRDLTADEVVNTYSRQMLQEIFGKYGEIKNARSLALRVTEQREQARLDSTGALVKAIEPLIPRNMRHKYLAQVFQAIRIEVNGELEALEAFLRQSVDMIRPGGRLVVIAYHSLEDRMVKNFMKTGSFEGKVDKDFYGNIHRPFFPVGKQPLKPGKEETEKNPRARSARLRVAERTELPGKQG